ncbi:hypothetical protein [Microbacterium suwonense]|uniref:Uncharacterized protein n=1 Tax=Microbacterium suwonense TaxID=683047 RepID=A0ABM8FTZ3_9MICO|nr:hypothetical protein [Microbacterium suwonense]BDZ39020.1 hypothetical protein GCM10025863_16340 [Microbacterium suwonense]
MCSFTGRPAVAQRRCTIAARPGVVNAASNPGSEIAEPGDRTTMGGVPGARTPAQPQPSPCRRASDSMLARPSTPRAPRAVAGSGETKANRRHMGNLGWWTDAET